MKKNALIISILVSVSLFASCNKKQVKQPGADAQNMNSQTQVIDDVAAVPGSTETLNETDIRKNEFVSNEGIRTVNFDFDRYALTTEMTDILDANAKILKEKKWNILIEGYCDSRGTVEYNLALGQKRAQVVKDYYIKLGVPESSLGTISYGEEKPLCSQETDECWSKNRRAETKVSM